MFDFLKRKSYDIEIVNGMKKLVIAKDLKKELNEIKSDLEGKLETINNIKVLDGSDLQKDLQDKLKKINDYLESVDKTEEAFNELEELSTYKEFRRDLDKKLSGVQKALDKLQKPKTTNQEQQEIVEEIQENAGVENATVEDLKEETTEGADGQSETDTDLEQNKEESLDKEITQSVSSKDIKVTADKAPGSSKYRAEGIKERLLEINKEVVNVKTPGVTYVGGVDKSVITPGPKSTIVKVKEEVVKPNKVVEQVKITIMRDEGEKGKLLPNKNIKMPKGDNVILKANKLENMDTEKVDNLDPEKRKKLFEELSEDDINTDTILEQNGVKKSSLYDEVMFKIFAGDNTESNNTESNNTESDNIDAEFDKVMEDLDKIKEEF